ncbi:MAG: DUF4149 domain-containing protein [Nitrospinae bacterium]|nr:DUF4149 domain-containing protein [Nitrospinota bacterium]
MLTFVKYVHLLSLVTWLGSMIFFSFVAAPSIFKEFERKQAGDIVGALFPKYFLLEEICVVASAGTLLLLGAKVGFGGGVKVGLVLLALMGGMVFYSGMVNGPRAREVKIEIRAAEGDEAKVAALRKEFGRLHGVSVIVNLAILALGLGLLYVALGYLSLLPKIA